MKRLIIVAGVMGQCLAIDWQIMRQVRHAQAGQFYARHEYAHAQKKYEQLVVDAPQDYEIVLGLANTLYSQEQYQQALQYYRMIVDQLSISADQREKALFNAGCAQVKSEQVQEALNSFQAVVQLNPKNERAQKNVEILKKLVQQPKKDKEQSEKNQSKKQTQQSSDHQPADTKKDKKEQSKHQDNRQSNNANANQNEGQCNDAREQKNSSKDQLEQSRNAQGSQHQNQNTPHDERAQPQPTQSTHSQTPATTHNPRPQSSEPGTPAQCVCTRLDKQSQEILREVAVVEKEGHALYVQALAGQRKDYEGRVHAW